MAKPNRAKFDREAKRLRAEDNLPVLKDYAVSVFVPKASYRRSDLYQMIGEAITRAVGEWWENNQSPGSCYKKIEKAAKAAARNWRGMGGSAVNVTWRGGYSTDQRKFGSQMHDHKAAVELAHVFGEAPSEQSEEETDANGGDKHDRREDAKAAIEEYKADKIDKGGVNTGAAEHIDHGMGDDGERLNPKDDGEAGYGVDGATRGLHTGRVSLSPYLIASLMAFHMESPGDQKWIEGIERAGGFDAWVSKNGHAKRARPRHEERFREILHRVRDNARAILKAGAPAPPSPGLGHRTLGDRPGHYQGEPAKPAPRVRGMPLPPVSPMRAAKPRATPKRREGRGWYFRPIPVGQGLEVTGHEWADQQKNLRAWKRHVKRYGPTLSLLDQLAGVRTMQWVKELRALGWGEPLVRLPTRSLLDV